MPKSTPKVLSPMEILMQQMKEYISAVTIMNGEESTPEQKFAFAQKDQTLLLAIIDNCGINLAHGQRHDCQNKTLVLLEKAFSMISGEKEAAVEKVMESVKSTTDQENDLRSKMSLSAEKYGTISEELEKCKVAEKEASSQFDETLKEHTNLAKEKEADVAEIDALKSSADAFECALRDELEPLLEGLVSDEADANAKVDRLSKHVPSNLEDSLISSYPIALKKPAAQRGEFDVMIGNMLKNRLQEVQQGQRKKITELENLLPSKFDERMAASTASFEIAKNAHSSSVEQLSECNERFKEAEKHKLNDETNLEAFLKDPEVKALNKVKEDKVNLLKQFEEFFLNFKNMKDPPPVVESKQMEVDETMASDEPSAVVGGA